MSAAPERQAALALLRGENWPWPRYTALFESAFIELLQRERLQPVLAYLFHTNPSLGRNWPESFKQTLHTQWLRQAARELIIAYATKEIIADLTSHGITPLLLKGIALAYWLYPSPETRPRGDVDILVRRRDIDRLCETFEQRDYRFSAYGILGQEFRYGRIVAGQGLEFDVHWRISAGLLLAHTLTYDEMLVESIPIPNLGEKARGLSPRHALLHACLHWARHKAGRDEELILWLYDMHLLVSGMTAADLKAFARLALNRQLGAICAAALRSTEAQLGTSVDHEIYLLLDSNSEREPSARLLLQGAPRLRLSDVFVRRTGSAWRETLKDIFLPPAGYIHRQYGTEGKTGLLRLRVQRLGKAISRLLADTRNKSRD